MFWKKPKEIQFCIRICFAGAGSGCEWLEVYHDSYEEAEISLKTLLSGLREAKKYICFSDILIDKEKFCYAYFPQSRKGGMRC